MKVKEIIIISTIGNQQKHIILTREHSFSTIYHISIDKIYQGQVLNINGWGVHPIEGSLLKDGNCDEILQAILNTEKTNS